jgi:hypothetical protein
MSGAGLCARLHAAGAAPRNADPVERSRAMSHGNGGLDLSPRERLLVAAANAVLAVFREPLAQRQLPLNATATLRLLESAVQPYETKPPPLWPPRK